MLDRWPNIDHLRGHMFILYYICYYHFCFVFVGHIIINQNNNNNKHTSRLNTTHVVKDTVYLLQL